MVRKYSILLGIIIATTLLLIATKYYPGGSQFDKNSIGYDWKNNYLSNLISEKAVNGLQNDSRLWAISGLLFLCVSLALFFIEFSKKISSNGAARIIKYLGVGAMVFAFLAVTPYYDATLTIASILTLTSMFYITVFVLMSRLYAFKILCIVCLLVSCCCNYIYDTRIHLELLPVMQKIALLITICWVLSLQHFTTATDFQSR